MSAFVTVCSSQHSCCGVVHPLSSPLCGLCEADLVKVGALCVSCPDSWLNYLLILFIGACVVAVVIFLIRGSSKRRSALASVARIAINFLQLVRAVQCAVDGEAGYILTHVLSVGADVRMPPWAACRHPCHPSLPTCWACPRWAMA